MKRILFILLLSGLHFPAFAQKPVLTGADRTKAWLPMLTGKRVGLLVNQTATIGNTHLVDSLLHLQVKVMKIFSPEHGFRGQADAGAKIGNTTDRQTGLPIISLYGQHRKPGATELADIDILIFDIQDVGTRFYTYISSLQEFMEAAAENNKPLIVLDRPNPNGHYIDGPVLDTAFRSFVGMQPIPIVHGMTVGEYAKMLNGERWLDLGMQCDLTVITCENYTHKTLYTLPVKPSPNLPNMASIYLYPSTCLFEGTVFSLGRGTDKPFQVYGHPSLPDHLFSFTPRSVPGATNPVLMNKTCYGYDLSHEAHADNKVRLDWLINAYQLFPEKNKFFNNFFNKLVGNKELMEQVRKGTPVDVIRQSWEPGLIVFRSIRKKYLLYEDF